MTDVLFFSLLNINSNANDRSVFFSLLNINSNANDRSAFL